MGQNKWKYSKKVHFLNRVRLSLRNKKIIINQIVVSKLWYISQIYTIPKYQKGNWKKNIQFSLERKKIQSPRHLAQLSIWRGILGVLDIETQLNYIKTKWIERSLNPTNSVWKDFVLYWLKLILNSDQGLPLFRKKPRSLQV